jgi:hypothetical protein
MIFERHSLKMHGYSAVRAGQSEMIWDDDPMKHTDEICFI